MIGTEINSLEDIERRLIERDEARKKASVGPILPLFGLPHAPDIGLHLGKERDDEWKRTDRK